MERKLWTLKCESCNETFGLVLSDDQDIIEFSLRHACPHCGETPDETYSGRHRVVGWRSTNGPDRS